MHPRLERFPRQRPDVRNLLEVLARRKPTRVPMLEIKLDDEIQAALLGEPLIPWFSSASREQQLASVRQHIGLMQRLGFEAFRIRTPISFSSVKDTTDDTADLTRGQRAWQNEHTGPIQSMADLEAYPWPKPSGLDYSQAEQFARELPEGMGCIAYISGPFEWASWLMGLEPFMIALHEQPGLIRELTDRVGQAIFDALAGYRGMAHVVAFWSGDDLGFKTGTLVSPGHLREYILPWHQRYAELAHSEGKPYLLHSCGNLANIFEDLVARVGVDARHSFEDVIQPVEQFHRAWHTRLAAIGGVDVDILARGSEADVTRRTREILEACAPHGAYCAGTGNSVTNYIPVDNYLAMIETLQEYNGQR